MDPTQALADARQALDDYRHSGAAVLAITAADKLSAAFDALDGWLSNGGFLPAQWQQGRGAE